MNVEISDSRASFTLHDIERFAEAARNAGALGDEHVDIHSTPGDRPFDGTYYTVSVRFERAV